MSSILVLGPNYDVERDQYLLGHLGTTGEEINANIQILLARGVVAIKDQSMVDDPQVAAALRCMGY